MEITEESIIEVFEKSEETSKKFHIYEILNALGDSSYIKDSDIFYDTSEENLAYIQNIFLLIDTLDKERQILNTEFSITTIEGEVCNPKNWEEVFLPIALGKANFDHFEWLIELNLH